VKTTKCKCGRAKMQRLLNDKRVLYPACTRCWADYIFESGPTAYTPRYDYSTGAEPSEADPKKVITVATPKNNAGLDDLPNRDDE
jgi:hypothetical protein